MRNVGSNGTGCIIQMETHQEKMLITIALIVQNPPPPKQRLLRREHKWKEEYHTVVIIITKHPIDCVVLLKINASKLIIEFYLFLNCSFVVNKLRE